MAKHHSNPEDHYLCSIYLFVKVGGLNLKHCPQSLKKAFGHNVQQMHSPIRMLWHVWTLQWLLSAPASYTSGCRWLLRGRSQQLGACQVVSFKARASLGLSRAPWQCFSGPKGEALGPHVKSVVGGIAGEELNWQLYGGHLADSNMLATSLRRHSGRGRGQWWCIAPGKKVTGDASCVLLQADPVWRNNSTMTVTKGVLLLPSHREKAGQTPCHTCGLAGVMGMRANISTG